MLGARTQLAAVIGHPVGHSRSPAMHNAAFAALGLDWAYLAFDVASGSVAAALAGARALGIRGLSVTMPHKEEAAAAADRRSPAVEALGAANTIVFGDDGSLWAENTDAPGFLAALGDAGPGADPKGRRCVVRGAGGAARAVVWALGEAGAGEVVVVPGRDRARAEATAALAGSTGRVGSEADVAGATIVMNATPLGLGGIDTRDEALPFTVDLVGPEHVVVDLVPRATTPFLDAARARGARVVDGLAMLVYQGALAFELWTGQEPPLEVMRAAVNEG